MSLEDIRLIERTGSADNERAQLNSTIEAIKDALDDVQEDLTEVSSSDQEELSGEVSPTNLLANEPTDGYYVIFNAADNTFTWQLIGAGDVTTGTFADARIAESNVTQHEAAIDHDALTNFVADEHIDWSVTGAEDVHVDRVSEGAVTQHEGALVAGSDTQVQFNLSGVFGADADFNWDYTNNRLGVGVTTPTATLHVGAGTATEAQLKLNSGVVLTTPEAGTLEYNGDALYFTPVAVRRAATMANGVIIADTTVENTTTETTAFTEAVAAGELHTGQRVKLYVEGIYSTGNDSDTFTIRVKVGGTTVATLNSAAANATDIPFSVDFAMTVRSSGATGSAVTRTTGTFDDVIQQAATTGPLVIDTTSAADITVTVQWDAANPDNEVTVQQGHAEFIN